MSLDLSYTNAKAAQLKQYANQLNTAKNNISINETNIKAAWKKSIVPEIGSLTDASVKELSLLFIELGEIASLIEQTAQQIKREEATAAEKAAAVASAAKTVNNTTVPNDVGSEVSLNNAPLSKVSQQIATLREEIENKKLIIAKYEKNKNKYWFSLVSGRAQLAVLQAELEILTKFN